MLREIPFCDIENLKVGHAQDVQARTGCTVVLCEKGAPAGLDVRGGGPASRESELLRPLANCDAIHAVVLSGGSAFGLDAAGGVMRWLKERHVGMDVGVGKVPLVCASCLFDLAVGSADTYPDAEMAYRACENAQTNCVASGPIGAGAGATVGKLFGIERSMPSGVGSYAVQIDDLQVGALAVVNALGDVYDIDDGQPIAGLRSEDLSALCSTERQMQRMHAGIPNLFVGNTTLCVVACNGRFDKTQMNKIAAMAQNGLARTIRPVHTMADGDSVYAISTSNRTADINVVGTLASEMVGRAINQAVRSAASVGFDDQG